MSYVISILQALFIFFLFFSSYRNIHKIKLNYLIEYSFDFDVGKFVLDILWALSVVIFIAFRDTKNSLYGSAFAKINKKLYVHFLLQLA